MSVGKYVSTYKYGGSILEVEMFGVGLQKRHFLSLKAGAIFQKWTCFFLCPIFKSATLYREKKWKNGLRA